MERKQELIEGEFFHIYNRGVDKREIFLNSNDYNRFLILLYLCNSDEPVNLQKIFHKFNGKSKGRTFTDIFSIQRKNELVEIVAWVLMPNHFHILLKGKKEGSISSFMRKVCTGYSYYFNQKYKRTGALFEGKFKSEYVDDDRYLKYLFSYIHLNPIKLISGESKWKENGLKNRSNAEKFIHQFKYSSLKDYTKDSGVFAGIINTNLANNFYPNFDEMLDGVVDWIK